MNIKESAKSSSAQIRKEAERYIASIIFPFACKQGSLSYAHSDEDIDKTLAFTWEVLKQM
ncbi:MAG: hypothetical protein WD824_21320 [Cyclobacteriaceae bacterium]